MTRDTHIPRPAERSAFPLALPAGLLLLSLIGVGAVSRYALLTIVLDGLGATGVLAPAILAGLAIVPVFRLGRMPLRWHLLLGAALGLGVTSLLTLTFGAMGLLQRPLWLAMLVVATAVGLLRFRTLLRDGSDDARSLCRKEMSAGSRGLKPAARGVVGRGSSCEAVSAMDRRWQALWLLVGPFVALALLAAAHAPGFLWREEGFGYDTLEYHLQVPKEYLAAGRITYLPHNVYANFPANVEMLYLLAMRVLGDMRDIGVTANLIHTTFGALTVFAAWAIGRDRSPLAGIVAGVVTATVGWFVYFAGLAYVENAMLFFGLTALGVLLRTAPRASARAIRMRASAVAGLLAGFACGCKYTAVPLIAAPLALAALVVANGSVGRRLGTTVVFGLAALASFAPWLIKGAAMTGNPVFPLANRVFHAHPPGWGEAETDRWDAGHAIPAGDRTVAARFSALWGKVVADRDQRFGPLLLSLGLIGLIGRKRDRTDAALIAVIAVQLGVWLFVTHLFARFAVVLVVPLAVLAGRSVTPSMSRRRSAAITLALLVGVAWSLVATAGLYARESSDPAPASLIYDGVLPVYEYFASVNHDLPRDTRLLLVGDAKAFYFERSVDYCVAFNRNRFFEAARDTADTDALLAWLRDSGYTHVLVNWGELRRLASTYGYSPFVEPDRLEKMFDGLIEVGLRRAAAFTYPGATGRYVDLFEISR